MLTIALIELSTKDLVFLSEENIIYGMSSTDNKLSRVKFKNMIISTFLTKSKLLKKPIFKSGFLTSKARLLFAELRQVSIKAQNFNHFDLK